MATLTEWEATLLSLPSSQKHPARRRRLRRPPAALPRDQLLGSAQPHRRRRPPLPPARGQRPAADLPSAHRTVTIVAADITLNANDRPPTPGIFTLSPLRPSLIVETNGRATTLSTSSGSIEATPVDGYGGLTGEPVQLTPGSPLALGASARWRLLWDGASDGSASPLLFST